MQRFCTGLLVSLLACAGSACADDTGDAGTASATAPTGATAPPPTTGPGPTSTGPGAPPTTGSAGESSGTTLAVKYDLGFETGETEGDPGSACAQAEATLSNQGCLFWAVDLPNAWQVSLSPAPESQTFALVAANTASAEATVAVFAGDDAEPLQTAAIAGGALHVFALDDALGTRNRESSFGTPTGSRATCRSRSTSSTRSTTRPRCSPTTPRCCSRRTCSGRTTPRSPATRCASATSASTTTPARSSRWSASRTRRR